MSRVHGVSDRRAGLLARFAFFMSRRKLGRVITPLRVIAHHNRLLCGYLHMELAQQASRSLPPALKALVDVEVARRIGCPF
jgi:4-carboxymuconolactone decarboxylase